MVKRTDVQLETYRNCKKLLQLLENSPTPLTCSQISVELGVHRQVMNTYCARLARDGWVQKGPMVPSRNRKSVICTWTRGTNQRAFTEDVYFNPQKEVIAITDEDLAWMDYYLEQRKQRYARYGRVMPAITP